MASAGCNLCEGNDADIAGELGGCQLESFHFLPAVSAHSELVGDSIKAMRIVENFSPQFVRLSSHARRQCFSLAFVGLRMSWISCYHSHSH